MQACQFYQNHCASCSCSPEFVKVAEVDSQIILLGSGELRPLVVERRLVLFRQIISASYSSQSRR